jgi:hypothetical protein
MCGPRGEESAALWNLKISEGHGGDCSGGGYLVAYAGIGNCQSVWKSMKMYGSRWREEKQEDIVSGQDCRGGSDE